MNCPYCQSPCAQEDEFCPFCGATLAHHPKSRMGSLWVPALILTVLSVIGLVFFFLHPMTSIPNETPWFYIEDGTLWFDPDLYDGPNEITVPASVAGQAVLYLGEGCFQDVSFVTTVELPEGLLGIGKDAFRNCESLRGIKLPKTLTSIEAGAFENCSQLEAIMIHSSVTAIGQDAFLGCEGLVHIFYMGTSGTWKGLYSDPIGPDTHVYCSDGSYLQR